MELSEVKARGTSRAHSRIRVGLESKNPLAPVLQRVGFHLSSQIPRTRDACDCHAIQISTEPAKNAQLKASRLQNQRPKHFAIFHFAAEALKFQKNFRAMTVEQKANLPAELRFGRDDN